jgi:sulfonate transport system ATP-binding protein
MALVIEGLGKTYPNGTRALTSVTLAVAVGEIIAVIGGLGCGKSTLLRLVAGLDAATEGRIVLDGAEIAGPHPAIGVVFQEPPLLPWLPVAGNVGFGLAGLAARTRRARVADALDKVGLADHADRWPRELSGGQAQRVAIARALIHVPRSCCSMSHFPRWTPLPGWISKIICWTCGTKRGQHCCW